MPTELVAPDLEHLPAYADALRRGWSPNTTRDVSAEQLAAIEHDPAAFLADLTRPEGGTVTLPDGRIVPRLPSVVRWMWDAEGFCGAINLRHQPGTLELPPHVSGHIGYSVVPWRQRQGHATRALALMLRVAHGLGLARVMVTCDVANEASRRVIAANGGVQAAIVPSTDGTAGEKRLFWVETGDGMRA